MKPPEAKIVVIDASPSGVSGDKYLGALLDLGGKAADLRKVASVVADNFPGANRVDVNVRRVERGEISAELVTVVSERKGGKRKASELLRIARRCIDKLRMSDWAARFSVSTLQTLTQAESKVHGHLPKDVELDELGSPDTLVDIIGVALLAESLGLGGAVWWSSQIAVGGGTTHFSNKTYPNPPPAVAEILRQNSFPMERGSANVELSTPTGAAITVNLASKYSPAYPIFRPEKIGYGAGSREIDVVANVLRLTVGSRVGLSHSHDEIVILETNLDDVSGEVIGHAVERLMSEGAKDVSVAPVLMKKGRPGHILSVIASSGMSERIASIIFEETGTLGVREIPVQRHIANREFSTIQLKLGSQSHKIRVKVAKTSAGRILRAKPEYEDLKKIAEVTGVNLRILASKAEKAAQDELTIRS